MKKCYKCKQNLPITEFNKHSKRKDGLQNKCKSCSSNMSKKYYTKHHTRMKKQIREKNIIRINIAKEYINNIKSSKGCLLCNENDFCVLDLHHLFSSNKEFDVSDMVRGGYSIETLNIELRKCIVLCSNCHRKYHANKFSLLPNIVTIQV